MLGVRHERFEYVEFDAGEFDGRARHPKRAGIGIELPVAKAQEACGGADLAVIGSISRVICIPRTEIDSGGPGAVPELHLDTHRKLIQIKWLGEVVVRPELQKVDAVRRSRASRDHDNRNRRVALANKGDQVLTRKPGQHKVGDNDVEGKGVRTNQQTSLAPRERLRAAHAATRQMRRDDLVDVRIVLHDEHARIGHANPLKRPGPRRRKHTRRDGRWTARCS